MSDVQARDARGTRARIDRRSVASIGDGIVGLLATTVLLVLLAAAFGFERLFGRGAARLRADDAHEG